MSDAAVKRLVTPKSVKTTRELKNQVPGVQTPGTASLMTLAVSVVVVAALYVARDMMIPITIAVLLSFVLAPLVGRLRRLGLWRVPSVLLAVFLALGIILALGAVIGIQLSQLSSQASVYAFTVGKKVDVIRTYATAQAEALSSRLGHSVEAPKPPAQAAPRGDDGPKPVPVEVRQPEPQPLDMVARIAVPVLSPLGSLGIILVVAVFILMQMEDLRDRMIRLFGSGDLHRTTAALDEAGERLSRYFLTQLALNAGFGTIVALGLWILGVPSPALFGIIAALFRFVPYVGSAGAALLPLLLAAAVDPGWGMVAETAAMFLVIELVTGQILEPLAYGHSTGLSPVSVVVSAIFWGWLWGPVGLILSMPLTLCLVVMGRHVEHLQFIDVLLGDQPALTPAEGFYQRILAGDADEALDQAEILLRDRPLSAYYDEVGLAGLQMAANDSLRGVLTDEQLRHVQESVGAVVLDLTGHDDEGPQVEPGSGAAGTVLCVAGRGPLDEAACSMVAQVLAKRGLSSRIVTTEAVARGAIETLDVSGVTMVCVSYLEAASSLSSLRYLMRRIHDRAPGMPTMVGLWHVDASALDQERLRTVIGADHYTTSLREAVAICVSWATVPLVEGTAEVVAAE